MCWLTMILFLFVVYLVSYMFYRIMFEDISLNDEFEVYFHIIYKDFDRVVGYFYVQYNNAEYKIFDTSDGWADYKTVKYDVLRLSLLFDRFEELNKMSLSFIERFFGRYQFKVLDSIRLSPSGNFEIGILDFRNLDKELKLMKQDFDKKFKTLKDGYAELNRILEGE